MRPRARLPYLADSVEAWMARFRAPTILVASAEWLLAILYRRGPGHAPEALVARELGLRVEAVLMAMDALNSHDQKQPIVERDPSTREFWLSDYGRGLAAHMLGEG